jgi:hypothetical protein
MPMTPYIIYAFIGDGRTHNFVSNGAPDAV